MWKNIYFNGNSVLNGTLIQMKPVLFVHMASHDYTIFHMASRYGTKTTAQCQRYSLVFPVRPTPRFNLHHDCLTHHFYQLFCEMLQQSESLVKHSALLQGSCLHRRYFCSRYLQLAAVVLQQQEVLPTENINIYLSRSTNIVYPETNRFKSQFSVLCLNFKGYF